MFREIRSREKLTEKVEKHYAFEQIKPQKELTIEELTAMLYQEINEAIETANSLVI